MRLVGGAITVRVSCFVVEPPTALLAVMVGVKVPATVGVPVILPVVVSIVSPAGNAPDVTLNLLALPEARIAVSGVMALPWP